MKISEEELLKRIDAIKSTKEKEKMPNGVNKKKGYAPYKHLKGIGGGGPPKKPINWEQFEKLCALQCTKSEICSMLDVSHTCLNDRVLDYYKEEYPIVHLKFAEQGKCSLRRNQFVLSQKNAQMGIFLGKNWLGQKDQDRLLELRRAELEYATAAIKHAERPIHSEQPNENLSTIEKTTDSLFGVDGADQYLARGSEKWKNVLVNPEVDQTS